MRGLVIPSINYTKISEHLAFQNHLLALYIWGEPTLAVPNVIFCAWVSHVPPSVSYILRLCKSYLPRTRWYVIYSPGTAPRATYEKLFLFRFSMAMQQKIAFSSWERAFLFFFFSFSFPLSFFLVKAVFFLSRCEGHDHWPFTARAFLTDINIWACNLL